MSNPDIFDAQPERDVDHDIKLLVERIHREDVPERLLDLARELQIAMDMKRGRRSER
jgi:hypothetical protein